jgi:hypothetical protein
MRRLQPAAALSPLHDVNHALFTAKQSVLDSHLAVTRHAPASGSSSAASTALRAQQLHVLSTAPLSDSAPLVCVF